MLVALGLFSYSRAEKAPAHPLGLSHAQMDKINESWAKVAALDSTLET